MTKFAVASAALAALVGLSNAASSAEWAKRSIYQVLTDRFALPDGSTDAPCDLLDYCGGTWTGLINKLDYIQGMGFTAVQISPVVENIPNITQYGAAYHGYWPINNYALNAHFGDAGDLSHLAQALHDRDMFLMVDVVINNMAQAINGTMPQPIDYSKLYPFNDAKYYHPYCNLTNYEDPTIAQNCWLGNEVVALPDLDTESDAVIKMTGDWIKELIANYSIDGLRIDAAKHIHNAFLPQFVEAAGVFTFGEVYTFDTDAMCLYQTENLIAGLPNYLEYFPLIRAFTVGDMYGLSQEKNATYHTCNNTSVLGTFSENHDLPRFASLNPDMTLAKNALTFVLLNDGIPTVYQGQEQHFNGTSSPDNRENLWKSGYNTDALLYNVTATLNTIRNHVISLDDRYATNHSIELHIDNSTMCTRKGPEGVQIVACFSNQGSNGGAYELEIPNAFATGQEVIDIFNCSRLTANRVGNLTIPMDGGEPRVYFPVDQMNGSGLCGFTKTKTNSSGNATSTSSGSKPSSTNGAQALGAKAGSIILGAVIAMGVWLL